MSELVLKQNQELLKKLQVFLIYQDMMSFVIFF